MRALQVRLNRGSTSRTARRDAAATWVRHAIGLTDHRSRGSVLDRGAQHRKRVTNAQEANKSFHAVHIDHISTAVLFESFDVAHRGPPHFGSSAPSDVDIDDDPHVANELVDWFNTMDLKCDGETGDDDERGDPEAKHPAQVGGSSAGRMCCVRVTEPKVTGREHFRASGRQQG
jgi:hypothetical protein